MSTPRALIFFLFLLPHLANARSPANPTLLSAFPLGGAPGSTLRLAVRGENLQGAYGVSFDCSMLNGEVQKVEDIEIVVVQLARLTQHAINDHRSLHRLRVGWRIVLGAGFGDNRFGVHHEP